MNPYEVLGVDGRATLKMIKTAWRKLSAVYHPDKETGDREKFEEAKLAFDVLSNPERRKRYDTTGRTDDSPVTPKRVRAAFEYIMGQVIDAQRPDGSTDDPCWENIRDKILLSIEGSRVVIRREKREAERKLRRAKTLLSRFKPRQEHDPIGDILRERVEEFQKQVDAQDDAMEQSLELTRVVRTYDYEVGPDPEGQCSPGPTTHRLLGGISTLVRPRPER